MRRACVHKAQLRGPRFAARRRLARRVLVEIAQKAPDPFTLSEGIEAQAIGPWPDGRERWLSLRFLVDHGFVRVAVKVHSHLFKYELTEQAIRWLDWTGFDWSVRKVA